jgi:hypothetical protein
MGVASKDSQGRNPVSQEPGVPGVHAGRGYPVDVHYMEACSDRIPSLAEADREYATNLGAQHPECAWIVSDRDAWYRNPSYRGPHVPHPESVFDEEDIPVDSHDPSPC